MRIILLNDVPSLGRAGDVREVKDGYARNYLIPRGMAATATAGNLQKLQRTVEATQQREARTRAELAATKTRLESRVVEVHARAGEDGRLFGSVTANDVAAAITRGGVEISKKQVELDEPIKTTGFYKVPVRLHHQQTAMVEVNVIGGQ